MKHPWLEVKGPERPALVPPPTPHNTSIVDNIRSFANSRKLRKAALKVFFSFLVYFCLHFTIDTRYIFIKVIATQMDGPEIEKLNAAFLRIDADGNG